MTLLQRTAGQCLCSQSRTGNLLRKDQAVPSEQAREAFFVFPLELGDWVLLGLLCMLSPVSRAKGTQFSSPCSCWKHIGASRFFRGLQPSGHRLSTVLVL